MVFPGLATNGLYTFVTYIEQVSLLLTGGISVASALVKPLCL